MSKEDLNYQQEMEGLRHATEVFLPSWAGFSGGITVGLVVDFAVKSEAIAVGSGVATGVLAFAGLRKFAKFVNSAG